MNGTSSAPRTIARVTYRVLAVPVLLFFGVVFGLLAAWAFLMGMAVGALGVPHAFGVVYRPSAAVTRWCGRTIGSLFR